MENNKIDFTQEVVKCFTEQFPKECEDYNKILNWQQFELTGDEIVRIYDDFIFKMDFVVTLINKLNLTQDGKEKR